jgi:Protein of unknown function (DUF3102)
VIDVKTFSYLGSQSWPGDVTSCHHIETIDFFGKVCIFCNATRSFIVTAFNNFTYSGLSQEHADQLRRLASVIRKTGCQQTATAVETGKMLIEAKADLDDGEFGEWCQSEAGYPRKTVQLLMNLAHLAGKEPDLLRIPVSAAYLLAAPPAPQQIIQQVLSFAAGG